MCTVTFIPRDVGYYLAMNRDEQLKRIAGLPPQQRISDGRRIVCPSEPGGGAWFSLNDAHVSFALINWYSVPAKVKGNWVSRGAVVNSVSSCVSNGEVKKRFEGLSLSQINPFRLIGIFPAARQVVEWRWDLHRLERREHLWKGQQWISSGHDEPTAQRVRSETFQRKMQEGTAGTLEWLRRLHGSHNPERGPFSTCMHRAEAATVSYNEIEVSGNCGLMRYQPGSPCMDSAFEICQLEEMQTMRG